MVIFVPEAQREPVVSGPAGRKADVKLSRLFQPRNPRFWYLVVLNLLSAGISYILRSHELPVAAVLVLATFALANGVVGIRVALSLMAEPPDAEGEER